jgi:tetratricopeptide (TPR) repeat protein
MKTFRIMILLTVVHFTNITQAQTDEINRVKGILADIFKNEIEIYDKKNEIKGKPKNILVLDDRIEFKIKKQKAIISFSDMFDFLSFSSTESTGLDGKKYIVSNELQTKDYILYFRMDWEVDKQYRHNMSIISLEKNRKKCESQLTSFEPIAAHYRALKVKPSITEEQRKYIVQANGFNEQKAYDKAIELYKKAIEIDQTAYPAAYSNLALLSAQLNQFNEAICYMKKFLMIEPEATDARSAQDKIYLWEAQLTQ